MSKIKSYIDVIDLWPDRQELADDLGIRYNTLNVMRHRNRIPSQHWRKVVASASKRRIRGVTLELLAELEEAQERAA